MSDHWNETIERMKSLAASPYCSPIIAKQLIEAAEKLRPPTKTVEVWLVEHAIPLGYRWQPVTSTYEDKASAERAARVCIEQGHKCVRLTGPHKREVPA